MAMVIRVTLGDLACFGYLVFIDYMTWIWIWDFGVGLLLCTCFRPSFRSLSTFSVFSRITPLYIDSILHILILFHSH